MCFDLVLEDGKLKLADSETNEVLQNELSNQVPNLEYDDKPWPTTINEEEKYFEAMENIEIDGPMLEDNEMTKGIDLLEKSTNVFDKELFIELLGLLYPCLGEDLIYCAPEMVWYTIKMKTGVDIKKVIKIFDDYHKEDSNCEFCNGNKQNLKRKFIDSIYPESNKRHC